MSLMMVSPFGFGDNLFCDPYWNQVELLLHCDGAHNGTTFTDSSVNAVTMSNIGVVTDTATSKFGGSSAYFGSSRLHTGTSSEFTFGINDFTIDFWLRPFAWPSVTGILFDGRPIGVNGAYPVLYLSPTGQVIYYVNSADRITSTALTLSQWYHIAVSRSGGVTRLFIDGVQAGSSWSDTTNYLQTGFAFGASYYHTSPSTQFSFNGNMDEIRITRGVGRFVSTFTPPTAAYYNIQCNWFFGADDVFLSSGFNDNDVVGDGRIFDGVVQATRSPTGASTTPNTGALFGYRYRSGGTGAYIRWPTAPIPDSYWSNAAGWSIDVWLNCNSSGGTVWVVRDAPTAGEVGPKQILHMLEVIDTGGIKYPKYSQSLEAYASTGGTGNWSTITSATALPATGWAHVRVCCKDGIVRLYQNAVEVGSNVGFNNTAPGSRNQFMLFNKDGTSGGSSAPFGGLIDSFCLFKRGFRGELTGTPTQEFDGLARFNEWIAIRSGSLTNSERKLIQTSGATEVSGRARAMLPISGKWYWEMEVGSSGAFMLGAGLSNTDDYNWRVLMRSSGVAMVTAPGVTTGTMSSFGAGRMMFAFDADARKLWIGQGGTWYALGDPASGTNPTFSTIPRVQLYPAIHGDNNGALHYADLCMTSETCLNAPPNGFYHLAEEYVPTFDRYYSSVKTLLNMGGSNGSTTFTDANGRTWTAAGNAQISTALGYNAGLFDGTGDYITTPYVQADFDWWTSDFTIEAWVYATSWANWSYTDGLLRPAMLGCADPTTTTNYWSFGPTSSGDLRFTYYNGSAQSISGPSIPTSTLSHIAFCKEGSGMYLSVNGTVTYCNTVAGTPQSSPTAPVKLVLGMINNRSIDGYVKALRITKGVSRYASKFSPPAAPFVTT